MATQQKRSSDSGGKYLQMQRKSEGVPRPQLLCDRAKRVRCGGGSCVCASERAGDQQRRERGGRSVVGLSVHSATLPAGL